MTELELHAMYAAHCRCCLLSAAMKDCAHCVFNVLEASVFADPTDQESHYPDPAHIAAATNAAYGDATDPRTDAQIAADADWKDLRATEQNARF